MPILHRYIAKELLSVALLAVLVLTSLMALCGLPKPCVSYYNICLQLGKP